MDRLATPQYHRARQGPRQAPVVCFPVSAVRPSGRLVGRAGCWHVLGLWFQLSQELAVWSSSPLSCLCRRDGTAPPISQSSCYQVCEITSVKVAYKLQSVAHLLRTIAAATLLSSCPHHQSGPSCGLNDNQMPREPGAPNSPCPEVCSLWVRVPSRMSPFPRNGPSVAFPGPRDPWIPRPSTRGIHRDSSLHSPFCNPPPNLLPCSWI